MASNPANPNDEIKGLIGWFAQNHVAANLMMAVVICLGLYAIASVKKESFPPFEFDRITVSVPYPGAGPEEVEEGIVVKIEEALNSDTPDLSESLGLPMSEAMAAHAARADTPDERDHRLEARRLER